MALPKISAPGERGFTFLEVILVIGLVAVLGGLGLVLSLDAYRTHAFYAERATLVSLLSTARTKALANIGESRHGVCLDAGAKQYKLFQGSSCSTGQELLRYPASDDITIQWPTEIVFDQLSGAVAVPVSITLSQNARVSRIEVNSAGRID